MGNLTGKITSLQHIPMDLISSTDRGLLGLNNSSNDQFFE